MKRVYKVSLFAFIIGGLSYLHLSSEHTDSAEIASINAMKKDVRKPIDMDKAVPSAPKNDQDLSILLKDINMNTKWGLAMTDSAKAWNITQGSKDIIIAIIDTGADIRHPSLQSNLWVNKGEVGTDKNGNDKATNGLDDDGNGYIDDVHGWNFVGNSNNVEDNHGHGTHIAGIIGGYSKDGKGITGVAPRVSLMVLKYYDANSTGADNLRNTVRAIRYAVEKGAHIINYSGGGLEPSDEEKKAIELAQDKGILFVAAAGNERSNSDIKGYYPADYGLSNIISVTAIDRSKNVLPTSNYGVKTVDIAAPGNEIYSTIPGGKFSHMTGTSQATAFVTGVAALVMANNRDLKPMQVIKHITSTGDIETSLEGKTKNQRRLNSYRALAILDQGLGVTGVVAENTARMKSSQFSLKHEDEPVQESQDTNLGGMLPLADLAQMQSILKHKLGQEEKTQTSAPR